jgi:hypothetical protein
MLSHCILKLNLEKNCYVFFTIHFYTRKWKIYIVYSDSHIKKYSFFCFSNRFVQVLLQIVNIKQNKKVKKYPYLYKKRAEFVVDSKFVKKSCKNYKHNLEIKFLYMPKLVKTYGKKEDLKGQFHEIFYFRFFS